MNRYQDIQELKTDTGLRYLSTTLYPEIPYSENDIYVYTTETDRLDNLSFQYYGDSSFYWVISIANPQVPFNSIFIPTNTLLRIPGNVSDIIYSFQTLNNSR
jgi:hypothetical protein